MIERQGGDRRVVDDYSLLPSAPDREVLCATRAGYLTTLQGRSHRTREQRTGRRTEQGG